MNWADDSNEVGKKEGMKAALTDLNGRLDSLEKVKNSHFFSFSLPFLTMFDWIFHSCFYCFMDRM